jgi:hypothetical protein
MHAPSKWVCAKRSGNTARVAVTRVIDPKGIHHDTPSNQQLAAPEDFYAYADSDVSGFLIDWRRSVINVNDSRAFGGATSGGRGASHRRPPHDKLEQRFRVDFTIRPRYPLANSPTPL